MASQETLKSLLDEFIEKEALIKEEIQVVNDEIGQLEARLEECRQRLSTIGTDRQKVTAMRERYVNGDFTAISTASLPAASPPQANPPVSLPTANPPATLPSSNPPVASLANIPPVSAPPVAAPPVTSTPASDPSKVVMEAPANVPSARSTRSGLAAILGGLGKPRPPVEEAPAILPPAEPPLPDVQPQQRDFLQYELDPPRPEAAPSEPVFRIDPGPTVQPAPPQPPPQPPPPVEDNGSPWGFDEQPRAEEPQPQAEQGVVELESTGEGEDDTVKSINDALRSLFR